MKRGSLQDKAGVMGKPGHREPAYHHMDTTVVKICTLRSYRPKFESWLCHLLAMEPESNNLPSIINGNEGCTSLIGLLQELR